MLKWLKLPQGPRVPARVGQTSLISFYSFSLASLVTNQLMDLFHIKNNFATMSLDRRWQEAFCSMLKSTFLSQGQLRMQTWLLFRTNLIYFAGLASTSVELCLVLIYFRHCFCLELCISSFFLLYYILIINDSCYST